MAESGQNSINRDRLHSNERTPLIHGRSTGDLYEESTEYYPRMTTNDTPVGFDRSFALTCIILHECLHSAAFYMIVPGLLYFLRTGPISHRYDDNWAVIITLIFAGVAFFLPLFGGIIGDTMMGRYKAILFGTVIELGGMVIVLVYACSVYFNEKIHNRLFPMLVVSLILIAFGMGFIKANVNPFGASQLKEGGVSVRKIQSYFRWYTFSINFGKLIAFFPVAFLLNYINKPETPSTFSPPVTHPHTTPGPQNLTTTPPNTSPHIRVHNLQSDYVNFKEGPMIATAIQVVFVGMATFIFMVGKAKYKMLPPSGGTQMNYIFCWHRRKFNPAMFTDHSQFVAQRNYERMVFRITLIIAALFGMYIFYEATYFQLLSTFMLQAKELAGPLPNFNLPLPFMNTFSSFLIIVMVPIMECFSKSFEEDLVTKNEVDKEASNDATVTRVRRTLNKRPDDQFRYSIRQPRDMSLLSQREADEEVRNYIAVEIAARKRRKTLLFRMCCGMAIAAMVALIAGVLETIRKQRIEQNLPKPSIFWQLPQYSLMGVAELFGVISAFEFAYTESFPGLQGFTTGMFISSYGLGSFLSLGIFMGLSHNARQPILNHIPMENGLYGLCAVSAVLMVMFAILGRQYIYRKNTVPLLLPNRLIDNYDVPDEI